MWSFTLRLREVGMATLCCIVATAQPPSRSAAGGMGWVGGGVVVVVVASEFMASLTAAQRWIYKVASYSISWSYYFIENYLCHKTTDVWGWDTVWALSATSVLFVVWFVFCEVPSIPDSCSFTNSFFFFLSLFLCTHRFFLKFFLKCNQNCLKNAGNPRDMRRFQVSCSCRCALQHMLCQVPPHFLELYVSIVLQHTRHPRASCNSRQTKHLQGLSFSH